MTCMADDAVDAPNEGREAQAQAPKLTRAEKDAADREAFLAADLEAEEETPAKAAKKAPAKKAPEPADEDDDVEESSDDDDDIDLDDDEDDADEGSDDEDEPETKADADPELAKRLAKVQRFEKRVREQADARERAFTKERDAFVAEWKPKLEAYEAFEKLRGRKSDPAGVLKALGFSEDDFADVSKILWALSKEGGADPNNKASVARMREMREMREQLEQANRRTEEIAKRLEKQDASAEDQRQAEAYMRRVEKSIGDDAPLAKKQLEIAPKATRKALSRIAYELASKAGAPVDHKKVVRAYEKKLDRMLERTAALRDAKQPTTAAPAKKKSTIEVVDKTKAKAAPKTAAPEVKTNGHTLLPEREEMIDRLRKIERGELDPDTD